MRRIILFILSAAMMTGGLSLVAAELFWANIIHFKFVIGGAVLATLGCYLLWEDFIAPMLGVEKTEK